MMASDCERCGCVEVIKNVNIKKHTKTQEELCTPKKLPKIMLFICCKPHVFTLKPKNLALLDPHHHAQQQPYANAGMYGV